VEFKDILMMKEFAEVSISILDCPVYASRDCTTPAARASPAKIGLKNCMNQKRHVIHISSLGAAVNKEVQQ